MQNSVAIGVDIPNILKGVATGPCHYAKQNGYLKISMGCVWKIKGLEKMVACPPITFDFWALEILISRRFSSFKSFYDIAIYANAAYAIASMPFENLHAYSFFV